MPSPATSFILAGAYAAENEPGIQAFSLDHNSVELARLGSFSGILNPSFIKMHPNGRWLYAVSETSQARDGIGGGVCALSFEREPFRMRLLNRQPSDGDWPCHLQLDASGRWLFCANYGTGSASVYPVREDGSLGEMSEHVQHSGSGTNPERQEGPHVHSVTLSPDNQFALVADLGLDQIVIYKFDATTGKLDQHKVTHTTPGAGPRHLDFHPNGQWLYVANEIDNSVTFYEYDKQKGSLVEKQNLSSLPAGAPENTIADIHISTLGERVYVSNRGHDSLAVYDVGKDGRLSLVGIPDSGGSCPRNFALMPGEKFMLVANQFNGEICVLPILDGKQALGPAVSRVTMKGASSIQVI